MDFSKLSQREKNLLLILGGTVILVLLYFLVIMPIIEYEGDSQSNFSSNINKSKQLEKIYLNYKKIKNKKDRIKSLLENKKDNITTLVQNWASSANISNKIAYTRSKESRIQNKFTKITTDIKINGAPIQALMKFLFSIENSNKLLNISYLKINPGLKGTQTYDALIKIESYIKN